MNDEQMLRYARHLMLEEIGFEGQEKLLNSRVAVVGVGGLGSPASMYLAAAGVGKLVLVDHDTVTLSNLQRQIIHTTQTLGRYKVDSAEQMIATLNPSTCVQTVAKTISSPEAEALMVDADIVLDCSDNGVARHAINQICHRLKKPLVSAAAIRWEGTLSVFDFRQAHSPCYACMFDPDDTLPPDNCATLGVFSPLLGVLGSMQAVEAIKLLLGMPTQLLGKLFMFNAKTSQSQYVTISKHGQCKVCAASG